MGNDPQRERLDRPFQVRIVDGGGLLETFDTEADANLAANKANIKANELGIKARYAVFPKPE
jgi:hypothetical protein